MSRDPRKGTSSPSAPFSRRVDSQCQGPSKSLEVTIPKALRRHRSSRSCKEMISWSQPTSIVSEMRWENSSQQTASLEAKFASLGIESSARKEHHKHDMIGEDEGENDNASIFGDRQSASRVAKAQLPQNGRPQSPARSKVNIQSIRKGMVQELQSRLRRKCVETPDQIVKTAKALEQLLWKQSKCNLDVYSDAATLNERLRALMAIMLRRRKHRSAKRSRYEVLVGILGHSRFCRIRDLVSSIRLAKIKKVATLQCNGDVCGKTFDSNVPFPFLVRRLFFDTVLVQAFESYPLERLRSLDWDRLATEAEKNLSDFHQWEAAHTNSSESSRSLEEL